MSRQSHILLGALLVASAGCASSEPRLMATERIEVERRPLSEPKYVESTFRCLQEQEITYHVTEHHGTEGGYGPEAILGVAVVGGAIALLFVEPQSWYYMGGAAGYGAYLLMPSEGESWTDESYETDKEIVQMTLEDCGRAGISAAPDRQKALFGSGRF